MNRSFRTLLIGAAAALSLAAAGCGQSTGGYIDAGGGGPKGPKDLTFSFETEDLAGTGGSDDAGGPIPGEKNGCMDQDPSCAGLEFDPANQKRFPLSTDKPADPNQANDGVGRDVNGFLVLDSTHASFDYLWGANSSDWSKGTVSKINSKTVREVGRYFTVTCNSLLTGNKMACDGKNGCCAMDSYPQFQNRQQKMPEGVAQQVLMGNNYPSRTSVDFNGDLWVANRAFGGQSSVTKICNDLPCCKDRNKNGKIDTSKDVDGDGLINSDCNMNNTADDLDDVKGAPCQNGMAQEFYGLDDECILLTTNTNVSNSTGRPLTLGPGALDFGPSDAYPGSYNSGKFFRIDGTTGKTKEEAQLPQGCQPYGAVVDSSGYLWAGNLGGPPLCYFNTKKVAETGKARTSTVGQQSGYGIGLDRDQNVWLACLGFGACRYTPNRKPGGAELPNGFWTMFQSPGANIGGGTAIGMAVDSRSVKQYFAWVAAGSSIVRIPASDTPLPNGMDVLIDGKAFPGVPIAGDGKGVGVDRDQNLWNIGGSGYATRVLVDVKGDMTKPDINSAPMGKNLCPAGDRCYLKHPNVSSSPGPYTYSDFTGFGLRNFTRPKGSWSYILSGCKDENMAPKDTRWMFIKWDAEVPLNTTLTARARSGKTPKPDQTWGAWTADFAMSPADLVNGVQPLIPNIKDNGGYLQVELDFATMAKDKSPKLKTVEVWWECDGIPG